MIDRHALRVVQFIIALLAAQFIASTASAAPVGGLVDGDYCDSDDGARSWSRVEKQRTRDRIAHACELVGGSPVYCEFWQAAITRESWGGVASAVCTRGEGELGYGPFCLSERWHRDKWPGDDELPAFCTPEAAFLVGHAIAMRAVEHYHAGSLAEIQAVFGGGKGWRICVDDRLPSWLRYFGFGWLIDRTADRRTCSVLPQPRHIRAVCSRMPLEICSSRITRADLGDHTDLLERVGNHWRVSAAGRTWALDLATKAP